MKLKVILSIFCVASLWSGAGFSETTIDELVKVTGEPKFSIEIDQEELRKISDSLAELEKLEKREMDINDLFKEGDEAAFKRAGSAVAEIFKSSSDRLIEMKTLIYRLAALVSLKDTQKIEKALYASYTQKFQDVYNVLMANFVRLNSEMSQALRSCKSELCVANLSEAQRELLEFGALFNQGVKVSQLEQWQVAWEFKSPFTKAVLERTFELFQPDNERVSVYTTILGTALTPFVAAARKSVDVGKYIGTFLMTAPTSLHLELEAVPVDMDIYEQKMVLDDLTYRLIFSIVNEVSLQDVSHLSYRYHVNVLSCKTVEGGCSDIENPGIMHILIGGGLNAECKNLRSEDRNRYSIEIDTLGPGIFLGVSKFLVIIKSFISMTPEGWWVGETVRAGVLGGIEQGFLLGKYGSLATIVGTSVSFGAAAGVSVLRIQASKE